MIRTKHSLQELDKRASIFYINVEEEMGLSKKLATKINVNDELVPIMTYLHKNLQTIITGRPEKLEEERDEINKEIKKTAEAYVKNKKPVYKDSQGNSILDDDVIIDQTIKEVVFPEIKKIFNYDLKGPGLEIASFVKIGKINGEKSKSGLAYRHAKWLGSNSCLYCNANFTFTIRKKEMKCRPQFDHFLNKDKYPYLALSFYNLIPCCNMCNMNRKGVSNFSVNTHLHPLVDDMEGLYEFRTKIKSVDFLVNGEDFSLKLRPCVGKTLDERRKAKNSIKRFGINYRYEQHKDIAIDIIKKASVYNNTAVENLFLSFKLGGVSIFKDENEVRELVMGNYMHPDNFHKRILSKLTKDIAEEFGISLI